MKPSLPLATCVCKFVAPDGVSPTSVAYHQGHRDAHLAAFPDCDEGTRENLNLFVRMAARGQFRPSAPRVVVS